jgi:hypothetical protein
MAFFLFLILIPRQNQFKRLIFHSSFIKIFLPLLFHFHKEYFHHQSHLIKIVNITQCFLNHSFNSKEFR